MCIAVVIVIVVAGTVVLAFVGLVVVVSLFVLLVVDAGIVTAGELAYDRIHARGTVAFFFLVLRMVLLLMLPL